MAGYEIHYGRKTLHFEVPDVWPVQVIAPAEVPAAADPRGCVEAALDHPLGGPRLEAYAEARTAAIAINDKTRPVPHGDLLPPLVARLEALGLGPEHITFYIATGTHPPMPPGEYAQVVPPALLARYPVVCHDAHDAASLLYKGESTRGTPIWIHRAYAESDLRIVVGNIEPHQFQGFSGGYKTAAIGLAGFETINRNHAWMTDPHADLGEYEHNPARQDVEEMGRRTGVHFALNAILNDDKKIVEVLAGDPAAVIARGIPRVLELYQSRLPGRFDLMIISPGGHPKDINLYQAQKALGHAVRVANSGATVILIAACPEGTGSQSYEAWMKDKTSYQQVFESFAREGFRVGPHKAFQIARDASRVRVVMLTEMAPDFVRHLLLTPAASLQGAIDAALAALPPGARIGVMPYANSTIPVVAPA